MKCSECNKNIIEPLYTYDGRCYCPYCKKEIRLFKGEFIYTEENIKWANIAKIYYYKSFNPQLLQEAKKRIRKEYLTKAISYVNYASELMNVDATYLLAVMYYYNYLGKELTKDIRLRQALGYLANIFCYNKDSILNRDTKTQIDIKNIKIDAAKLGFNIIENLSPSIRNSDYVKKLLSYISMNYRDYINYNVKINVDSFETNINNLLNNKQFLLSFNKYNGQELANLYDNLKNNKEFNTKKISVFFINEDNLKSISRSNDINSLKGFAYLFSTHNKWEEINDVSKNYYVYMINLVKSNLIKNGGKYLDEFIRSLEGNEISKKLSIYDKNYVFTASDLYIRIDKTSKREVIKAYKKLVESVGNNED